MNERQHEVEHRRAAYRVASALRRHHPGRTAHVLSRWAELCAQAERLPAGEALRHHWALARDEFASLDDEGHRG